MANVRSNVILKFGLLSATVNLSSALVPRPSNVMVWIDGEGKACRVHQKLFCGETEVPRSETKRAREVNGGLVLLTDEDQAKVKALAEEFKAAINLTPHPADQVATGSVPGDKAYYLTPATGHEDAWAVLREVIRSHPELAFMAKFTVRSNMAVYQVVVRGESLLLQERVAADSLRPAPDVAGGNEAMQTQMIGMAEQIVSLPGVVQDFALDEYRDKAEDVLADLISGRSILDDPGRPKSAKEKAVPSEVVPAMEALQRMLDAASSALPSKERETA